MLVITVGANKISVIDAEFICLLFDINRARDNDKCSSFGGVVSMFAEKFSQVNEASTFVIGASTSQSVPSSHLSTSIGSPGFRSWARLVGVVRRVCVCRVDRCLSCILRGKAAIEATTRVIVGRCRMCVRGLRLARRTLREAGYSVFGFHQISTKWTVMPSLWGIAPRCESCMSSASLYSSWLMRKLVAHISASGLPTDP